VSGLTGKFEYLQTNRIWTMMRMKQRFVSKSRRIGGLSLTGLLDDGELHHHVLPCRVFSKAEDPHLVVPLKDTKKSVCFAISTSRFLIYDGRDMFHDPRKVHKRCTGKRSSTVRPLLCTSFHLGSQSQRRHTISTLRPKSFALLDTSQKILLDGG
jgi:hypothetical protein